MPDDDATQHRLARRLLIEGRVQGVGYRDWMVGTARRLGLHGWVRNRQDGSVEALVAGPSDIINALLAACRDGPPAARVRAINATPADHPDIPGFHRAPTV
jgi:acylphosphatase